MLGMGKSWPNYKPGLRCLETIKNVGIMITPCVAIFSISKTIRFPVSFMKAIIAFILPEVKMGEKVVLKFFQVSPDAMVI